MTEPVDAIVYEDENGYPVELLGPSEFEQAVASGALTPATQVKVYDASGSFRRQRAGEVEILQAFFNPVPSPAAMTEDPWAMLAARRAHLRVAWTPPSPTLLVQTPLPAALARDALEQSDGFGWWVLGAAALAGMLWVALQERPTAEQLARASAQQAPASSAAPPSDADTVATVFATRPTRLRAAPARDARSLGELARGQSFAGRLMRDSAGATEFYRIESGARRGAFVWAGNVAAAAPPALNGAQAGRRLAVRNATLYSRPGEGSAPVGQVVPGQELVLAGATGDGWFEVVRPASGVAYVEAAALLGPALDEQRTRAPLPMPERRMRLVNDCPFNVRLWLLYQSRSGWQEGRGWGVAPGERFALEPFGAPILPSTNAVFHYAETLGGQRVVAGDVARTVGDRTLPMQATTMQVDDCGNYVLRLTCS